MRPKCHVFRRETAPYRDDLVGLAGVRVQQMLEERIAGAWNILRRNGNEVVVHDMAYLGSAIIANTTKGATGAPLEAYRNCRLNCPCTSSAARTAAACLVFPARSDYRAKDTSPWDRSAGWHGTRARCPPAPPPGWSPRSFLLDAATGMLPENKPSASATGWSMCCSLYRATPTLCSRH